MMSFPRFLEASYALLHEGYQSVDETIPQATQRLTQWALPKEEKKAVSSSNDQAIAALKARMAGVAGKPKMA